MKLDALLVKINCLLTVSCPHVLSMCPTLASPCPCALGSKHLNPTCCNQTFLLMSLNSWWWGHLNPACCNWTQVFIRWMVGTPEPRCCNPACLNFLHSKIVGIKTSIVFNCLHTLCPCAVLFLHPGTQKFT